MAEGTPWLYFLLRVLFKFVLKIFYGTIVVENTDLIPENGQPCIVCANHSNSLTDALLLITCIPSKKRNQLRLTAKSTLFGRKTPSSWFIESVGTIPIKRRKDFVDGNADNTDVMQRLMEALEMGDAVCLFPEGISRYHSAIGPLKTGVARLVSDVLTRNRSNPDFEISLLTCSVTYMHRQHFRSDVLITFNPPMKFRPRDNPDLLAPVEYKHIRSLTTQIRQQISTGTIDSPSWDLVRTGKLAARIYAPLGTRMRLGNHVRTVRAFIDALKGPEDNHDKHGDPQEGERGDTDRILDVERSQLRRDLKAYQDQLARWGIKDDRIRQPLPRRAIISRLLVRFLWSLFLFCLSLPGLLLWLPVFAATAYAVHKLKKTGPTFDTWDEIAQNKLMYGLISGLCVWFTAVLLTLPFATVTIFLVPALMWISLRWLEDAVSAFRAFMALVRLLCVGKPTLRKMAAKRKELHSRVMNMATHTLHLPENPESYFMEAGGMEKGRVTGEWDSRVRYFSVRRRRKRDWNETLRLYDKVDYPDE